MPKIPRDLSGADLCGLLARIGYRVVRQHGSHLRLEANHRSGIHRITIPDHDPVKIGTLNSILSDIAGALDIEKSELAERLFGR